jgi:hypothetical protein
MRQNILAADLVVQGGKAILGFSLRFGMLPGAVHPRPGRAAPGAYGVLANRAGLADAPGTCTPARQELRLARDPDQPASC